MKKILFVIHDLGPGGAEKVLVNLVNNMDPQKFDVTVMALFGGGVNEQFLKPHIHYRYCFKHMIRGNSHLMKLLTPRQLHKWLIKEHYDVEVSYLEGPTARIISGCPHRNTKKVAWIHCLATQKTNVTLGFRSYNEAIKSYSKFDKIVCVSKSSETAFQNVFPNIDRTAVLYNTYDSETVIQLSNEPVDLAFQPEYIHLISTGRLIPIKGYDRLMRVYTRLKADGYQLKCYILGNGEIHKELERKAYELGIDDGFKFLGYHINPYKYVANCNLYVCSSLSEGFSTAATEALIVGTPVCTVDVSGMKEMLGENGEYGIVTENSEDALYLGIKKLLDDPSLLEHYKNMATVRGKDFSTETTVKAVEKMLETVLE